MSGDALEEAIRDALVDGRLPCERAFDIATRLRVSPVRLGEEATRWGVKISRCQLGLFGFEANEPGRVTPAPHVMESLREAIEARLAESKLPCAAAWAIAGKLRLPKLKVATAVEALGLKISHCQLGCF